MRLSRRTLPIILVCLTVLLAGCAGWGTDGPADDDGDPAPDEADDLEEADDDATDEGDEQSEAGVAGDEGEEDADDTTEDDEASTDDEASGDDADGTESPTSDDGDADSDDASDDDDQSDTDGDSSDESDDANDDAASNGDEDTEVDDDESSNDGEDTETEMYQFLTTIEVVDEDGEPVEGETVTAWSAGASDTSEEYTTDGNGEVVLEGSSSDPSDVIQMIVQVDDEERTVHLDANEHTETFTVSAEDTHTLTVYAGEAVPVEGADITLERHSDGATTDRTTDENGTVDYTVIDGEYTVTGEDPNGETGSADVTIDGEDDEVLLETLSPPMPEVYDVSMTVVDADSGEPIEDARLEGAGNWHPLTGDQFVQVTTDPDGTGTADAYEGHYSADLRADGYETQSVEVAIEDDIELEYEMTPLAETDGGNDTASVENTATTLTASA